MATTINAQNALQIREKPMEIYVTLQTGSSAKISSYSPQGSYKSYDGTLGDSSISMRDIADLAGDGFPLDGSYRLYDPNEATDATNGKLGLRGNAGQDVAVTITASATLTAVTIATRGAGTISVAGGTTYTATGLNVIPINASSATLTITPAETNGRAEVDYIVPGIILTATNDTLIRCALSLRGNLAVIDHTWEESEIEIQMYYPYDISSSFAYVQNDWPITYRAGYDSDLSEERKFYLSEPIEQVDNIITIKGVDASHWLEDKTLIEQWYSSKTGNAHQTIYSKFIDTIKSAGITLERQQAWSGSASGASQLAIIPEMSARDFVAGVMNLSMNHKRGGSQFGIQFVDAGIPTVEHGDGKIYGNTWTINKSDVGELSEIYEQNIAKLQDTNDEINYNSAVSYSTDSSNGVRVLNEYKSGVKTGERGDYSLIKKNTILDYSYDSFSMLMDCQNVSIIQSRPSGGTFKASNDSSWQEITPSGGYWRINNAKRIIVYRAQISGGVKGFSNPNGLPGVVVEMDPFVYGNITDGTDQVFNYQSLFNRSNKTISFTWKGDPRMQPLDYIDIVDDTVTPNVTKTYRATLIELSHDGGGTTAKIEAREWT